MLRTEALILRKITGYSGFKTDVKQFDHLKNLVLADPAINDVGKVDLLLGIAEFSMIALDGLLRGPKASPMAQNTQFGWLIRGPTEAKMPTETVKINSLLSNVELHDQIKSFFQTEGVENNDDDDSSDEENEEKMTDEERYCEQHFLKTIRRNDEGRFIATMPFKNGEPKLGDSKKIALATLF